jgi:hypothetical protein
MKICLMLLLLCTACNAVQKENPSAGGAPADGQIRMINEGQIRWITSNTFGIVDLAGCEYIVSNVYQGYNLTHKGNCNYCQQRANMPEAELFD